MFLILGAFVWASQKTVLVYPKSAIRHSTSASNTPLSPGSCNLCAAKLVGACCRDPGMPRLVAPQPFAPSIPCPASFIELFPEPHRISTACDFHLRPDQGNVYFASPVEDLISQAAEAETSVHARKTQIRTLLN